MRGRSPESVAGRRNGSRRPASRSGRGAGAGRPSSPAPESVSWLRRRGTIIAAAATGAAVGAAVVIIVNVASSGDDPEAAFDDRVAELQAAEESRNAENVTALSGIAVDVHDELLPVLDGLNTALPVDGAAPASPATPDDVSGWRTAVDHAIDMFGDPPSGSTEVNITRNGLVLSAELLASSVDSYEAAVQSDDPEQSVRLETLADDLRMRAVDAWSVAATQLDVLNVDAGNGHVHVYLPARPGEEMVSPPDGELPMPDHEGHDEEGAE